MSKQHLPLMPKATAMWLVDNTTLTFKQIAEFSGLHELQVQAMADGDVGSTITSTNPIYNGELDKEEIERCEKNVNAKLHLKKSDLPEPLMRSKGPRYTPVAKRDDKPNGIAWLLKHHPELGDSQIVRLIGTTKDTIEKVRDRTHWNSSNIRPSNPILAGLCKQIDLDASVRRAQRKQERLGIAPTQTAETTLAADATPDEDADSDAVAVNE